MLIFGAMEVVSLAKDKYLSFSFSENVCRIDSFFSSDKFRALGNVW